MNTAETARAAAMAAPATVPDAAQPAKRDAEKPVET
jgi:hypothetical protein